MLVLVFSSFSQKVEMPDGAYKTANDFLNNTPSFINQFTIVKRNEGNISDFGGSMFKVVPTDKSLKREFIKYGLWGVVWKDTLYINNSKFSFNWGYNQVDYLGDHFVLFVSNVVVEDELRTTEWSNVREKIDFILRYKRGVAYSFDKDKYFILNDIGMEWLIKDYPELMAGFEQLLSSEYKDDQTEIAKRFEIIKKLDRQLQLEGQ